MIKWLSNSWVGRLYRYFSYNKAEAFFASVLGLLVLSLLVLLWFVAQQVVESNMRSLQQTIARKTMQNALDGQVVKVLHIELHDSKVLIEQQTGTRKILTIDFTKNIPVVGENWVIQSQEHDMFFSEKK